MDDTDIDSASAAYARRHAALCARVRWTPGQLLLGVLLLAAVGTGLLLAPQHAWVVFSTLIALVVASTLGLRLLAMAVAAFRDPTIRVSASQLATLDPQTLPRYSLLVPLYREPEVLPQLLAALEALDYPHERLDIQFLIEPDDEQTGQALSQLSLPAHMRITVAPSGMPRTKPRACNTGLELATGELLVIYDAEDRPEPDQLRKAAWAYRSLPPELVCLQCRLDHYNSQQSLPARWTAIDYLMWYRLVLPGLQTLRAPIPLGGTSNHFRIEALRELGGWDPFNVTEDCDLGLRIARRGWRTGMLASTTWEEAVVDARAWVRQRSRWLKGYLQSWMVHSRSRAWRAFGFGGWALMSLYTVGLVASLIVHPVAWATVALWLAIGWSVVDTQSALSMATLVITCALLLSNLVVVAVAMFTCLCVSRRDLLAAAALSPLSWVMQSVAAWTAAWEYVVKPFHWQKTRHGQAVQDAGVRRAWQGLLPVIAVVVVAAPLLLLAGERITDDLARQAAARLPPPPPTQAALHYVGSGRAVTGLVHAERAAASATWQLVETSGLPPSGAAEPMPVLQAAADFPHARLEMISHQTRDFDAAAALAFDVQVPADAPHDLRAAVHWRDEDGRWFQSLTEQRLIPGAWTRLEFPLHEPDRWQAADHLRAWHPDLLRRVGELGISFFSALPYRGPISVANLRELAFDAEERAARDQRAPRLLRPAPEQLPVMAPWELALDLGRSWSNPYDPEEVALDCEFTTPDGTVQSVPGFYFQDYRRRLEAGRELLEATGAPSWRIRYRARSPGLHRWRVLLADHGAEAQVVAQGSFTAVEAQHLGYIRRSEQKPEYFARDDGSFYYPIGQNLCHAIDLLPPLEYSFTTPPDQGSFTFDRYFERMAAARMNLARIWMTPWSYGLEANADWQHFHGLGRYSLANAWKLDHLLDAGERLGIDLLLTMTHMSEFQTKWGSNAWVDSVWNQSNGGPLRRAEEFFTHPEVMRHYRQRMRYIVARWGDRPNILAWEFFGEANLMPGFNAAACAAWHQELARYVRPLDHQRHLIFTHTHNWQLGHELWRLPEIDCVQGNGYIRPPNHSTSHVINFTGYLREVTHYRKPVLVAEYGGRSELGAPSEDYLLGQLHSGLWASFMKPFAGLGLQWWWNFTDGADLYGHYLGLARFAEGIDRVARDYRPVEPALRSGPGLLATGIQDSDSGCYWIYHRGIFEAWADLPSVSGAGLQLSGLAPGRYRIEFWHTVSGEVLEIREQMLSHGSEIALPEVRRDLALKLTRIAP